MTARRFGKRSSSTGSKDRSERACNSVVMLTPQKAGTALQRLLPWRNGCVDGGFWTSPTLGRPRQNESLAYKEARQ
jgi:hypothetical protein